MREATIFLHGRYRKQDLPFYRRLCRRRFRIAVDGGYAFFKKAGIVPDLLIGDFDSLRRIPRNLPPSTEVLSHPIRKDATDAELALDYCLERGARLIDIVQPSCGDLDHLTGNLMLLTREANQGKGRYKPLIRMVDVSSEIFYIDSGEWTLRGARGNPVSVLPLSRRIVLSCSGTDFDVERKTIRRGETIGLRNRIRTQRAHFEIKGQALIFHSV
jgi:thiamine pyrophosphokinase